MSAGFTPGPWKFGVRSDGSIWQSRGNPLEGAHYQNDFFGTEADAHLIAAAPDLYDAGKSILASLEGGGLGSNRQIEALRAAIAKADGETA